MKLRILTLLIVIAVPFTATGRLIELWPYDKLRERSDVVVIGAVESVDEFDGTTGISQFGDELEPQVTTFKIHGVLSGEHDGETLELVHCRMKEEGAIVANGPLLAEFESDGRTIRVESGTNAGMVLQENKPSYLLFLKRRDDGRYEPVAGQVDSQLSVRSVSSAFGF